MIGVELWRKVLDEKFEIILSFRKEDEHISLITLD